MFWLWVKAFHIFFVVSWFAGLFYLPRIFVNLAMVPADNAAERERLLLMARKLYKFVTPIGLLAVGLGLWLWLGFDIFSGNWLYVKAALVCILLGYHFFCGKLLKDFIAGRNRRPHVWYRFFNEGPVLLLLAICVLAVIKPFSF
ncbi:MAG: CopD family protein [Zoogloeaceae bacterium]|jgi:putative membrane protein|nr:CopD family protein [Zoogloeaceae bacterium]